MVVLTEAYINITFKHIQRPPELTFSVCCNSGEYNLLLFVKYGLHI